MTPEQIARTALAELGEQPGPDPIAQIRAIAAEATATLRDARPDAGQLAALAHGNPAALDACLAYERAMDRAHTALAGAAHIDNAQRLDAALQRIADDVLADYPVHAPETP